MAAAGAATFCRFPFLLVGFDTGISGAASVSIPVMTSDLVRYLLLRRRTGPSCSCCYGGNVSSSGVDVDVDNCSLFVTCKLARRRDCISYGTWCCGTMTGLGCV